MAKEKSTEIVDEEADMTRRFETLEKNASESKSLLDKIAAKVLGTEPPPKEKDKKDEKPAATGGKKFFQDIGILAKD